MVSNLRCFFFSHTQCSPWSSKACCTPEVAAKAHQHVNHLNFDIMHCGPHAISQQCHAELVRELCYYSCDPYVAPWITPPEHAFMQERLMMVPLCESECTRWWNACADSYTCVRNWRKHFEQTQDPVTNLTINRCPAESSCQQVRDIFASATDFCETVSLTLFNFKC